MNKLIGTVSYDYEIFPEVTPANTYEKGEKEFVDDLGFMIETHVENQEEEIQNEIGSDIFCNEGKGENGKALVNIEIRDLEACRKVLAEEAEEELDNVTDEDVLQFVGEVIANVDAPDLRIAVCQKSISDEEVKNYFVFNEDLVDDIDKIDDGYISLKVANVSIISAEH